MLAPQEGLDRKCEYPVKFGKYDVFANMKWLQVEVDKKHQQQYMEHRLKLYQQRCVVPDDGKNEKTGSWPKKSQKLSLDTVASR